MKIIFINKYFFQKGGSERVFFQERDFIQKSGAKVLDFSMKDPRNILSPYSDYFISTIDYKKEKGLLKKIYEGFSIVHSAEAVKNLTALVQKEKPDIAHLHNIYHQLTPSIIQVLKNYGAKVVITLHDGKLICPAYQMLNKSNVCIECEGKYFWKPVWLNCQNSYKYAFMIMLEAYWHMWLKSYEKVDKFIVPSRFFRELVSKRITIDKIKVLNNGVDHHQYVPNYKDRGYSVYFGRISKEKGIETLLNAQNYFGSDKKLKIVGTGPLMKDLQNRYQHIEFIGFKDGSELKKIVADSAFVIVPSEWYENCSMVVLEAMAMGKPVIGARIGGIPEQIEDHHSGLLFEPGDVRDLRQKMVFLWNDPSKRKKMGMVARKKLINDYSLDSHCSRLMKEYEKLLT